MLADFHVYGGLTAVGAGLAMWIAPGLGLAAVGLGLIILGSVYAYSEAHEPEPDEHPADQEDEELA